MESSVDHLSASDTVLSSALPRSSGPRTVLLTSTCWWPFAARIAMRFAALGWRTEALCPRGHPLRATQAVTRLHDDAPLRPIEALAAAIAGASPDLIVPCDDRAFAYLHLLHCRADAGGSAASLAIARSLGRPDSYAVAERRSDLIRIAREEGIRAPETRTVAGPEDLHATIADFGLPVVLKVDGTWGGSGVIVARTRTEAERAWRALARRLDMGRALKRLLVDRDPYHVRPWLTRQAPRVSVQRFVHGRPANSIAACWNGEVLANIEVEVLLAHDPLGASDVVRAIAQPDMVHAAERVIGRLGLSGFCGFDFVIEDGTSDAHLIEMNPRATPICHLALGPRHDPVAALVARLEGASPPDAATITSNPVIAFFPQASHYAPDSELLSSGYHDVPWDDPELVRELRRLPYPQRGGLARLLARLRRGPRRDATIALDIAAG